MHLAPQRAGVVAAPAIGATGRRFAYRPRPLRRPSRPCSGRGLCGVGRVPLRAADGGEQHGVGAAAGREHLVGQRGAVGVDRGAAEDVLLELEARRAARAARASAP